MTAAVETQEQEQVQEVTIEEGSVVKVGRKQYTVARVGKECKLVHKDGSEIWRHSRTVAKLQAS